MYSRSTWGAAAEKKVSGSPAQADVITNDPVTNADRVVIHHTVTGEGDGTVAGTAAILRSIQRHHQSINWNDIGYHTLVDRAGNVFEGRALSRRGAHSAPNSRAKAISYIGNTQNGLPSAAALAGIKRAYRHIIEKAGKALPVYGHRDRQSTACPGSHLYTWMGNNLARSGQIPTGWLDEVKKVAGYLNSRAGEVNRQATTASVNGIPGPVYWRLLQALAQKDGLYTGVIDGVPGQNTYRAEDHYYSVVLNPPAPEPEPQPEPDPVEPEPVPEPGEPGEIDDGNGGITPPQIPELPEKEEGEMENKSLIARALIWLVATLKRVTTLSELGIAVIRTAVPYGFGVLLTWLAGSFGWLAEVPAEIVSEVSIGLVWVIGTFWYFGIRELAKRWPQLEWLLGYPEKPVYGGLTYTEQEADHNSSK